MIYYIFLNESYALYLIERSGGRIFGKVSPKYNLCPFFWEAYRQIHESDIRTVRQPYRKTDANRSIPFFLSSSLGPKSLPLLL
ncbi:hypothetical protein HQ45_01615 [Porphyromonas crevioricanis]|uniref:Uncharacterized protein n=1 Tax=Porphyromonas crevioricanis TaxID=393921 RepID=A0AB34PFQ5_9PORP|nr:hypothetical protein HQ45_01615 [Porphyromonas crevioricanis]KGN95007.1 hypothetical protein HQ38_04225 [Porphyromonas crevioricanis]